MFQSLKIRFPVLLFGLLFLSACTAEISQKNSALSIQRDIPWTQAGDRQLTADIIAPKDADKPLPVVVIYHGGGWLINDNRIMDSTAQYLASHGQFVVANMNYRLLGDNGNTTTMDDIVEDALGGLLWVKENIARYGGDPARVAVTGDSAGGHLSAMVLLAARNLSNEDFSPANLAFKPSYIPSGKTPEQIAAEDGLRVQAAVLSYGAFDIFNAAQNGFESPQNIFWKMGNTQARGLFGKNYSVEKQPELYRAVSPIHQIPAAADYRLPPVFAHVGSKDATTPPAAVEDFVERLRAAGQPAEFRLYPGKNHAFLDNGCNEYLGTCFDRDAPDTLDDMISFLHRSFDGTD